MKNEVKHLDLLDYARGIAILSVLAYHALGAVYGKSELPWDGLVRDFPLDSFLCFLPASFGQMGVAVFFVISGFCIHLSFQRQGQNWKAFFTRRFFRLYPAYLAALVLFLIFDAYNSNLNPEIGKSIFMHLFLIFNYCHAVYWDFNGVFWTLAIEAQLYLIYPALLFLVGKFGWKKTLIIIGIIEFLLRLGDGAGMVENSMANLFWSQLSWRGANNPFAFWFSWSIGAYLADAFLKNEPLPFRKVLIGPVLWVGIISYFIHPLVPFMFPLFALATAIILSRLLSGEKPTIRLPEFSLAALKKIGLWSYSIYLLHEPFMEMHSFMAWLAIVPLAFLWYKIFELPGIALGKRIIGKII